MSNDLQIAVSGKSGCGNSTVSRIVADRLGLRFINYTFKDIALERGMSFEDLYRMAGTDNQYDLYLDRRQVELAEAGGCVLGSRLAVWLLKDAALTVYLKASPESRASRIAKREGKRLEEVFAAMMERDRSDRERYLTLYGYDIDQYDFVDLIVDTDQGDQFFVADRITEWVQQRRI